MTREQAAELRVLKALEQIEAAQHLMGSACAQLSAICGCQSHWSACSKLYDRIHQQWRKTAYADRSKWKLDHEPNEEGKDETLLRPLQNQLDARCLLARDF